MSTMQAFYKSLMSAAGASSNSNARRDNLVRLTRASRAQLLTLKSYVDWTIWHDPKAPVVAR